VGGFLLVRLNYPLMRLVVRKPMWPRGFPWNISKVERKGELGLKHRDDMARLCVPDSVSIGWWVGPQPT